MGLSANQSQSLTAKILNESVKEIGVYNSLPPKDDLVDLSELFAPKKMVAGHLREYLDLFIHQAVFWDDEIASKNLQLDNEFFDARKVKSLTSQSSFKTVYSNVPFLSGGRYYFEIQLLHGCNFKLGVSATRR